MSPSHPNWLANSLNNFWQAVNWENLQIAPQSNGSLIDRRLSVKAYFQSIPWVVTTVAAPQLSAPVSSVNGTETQDTLNDFLQDISEFF